ncbi:VOC family protein [Trichlorobacter ammonificans]|uniref:VOC domain-containing protein n=1 Tax=Trichlorobacter ammonificans TaxID=2916410 RepID=A0ABM9DBR5_9BACT|nr:VOC family protein [Trichlorobacter ammonificans]CAH2032679.1 VOC domain-containing protein [Trichlorobacter ammonificans]
MSISMKNVVVFVTDLGRAKSFYADQLGLPLAGETQMLLEFFPATGTTLGIALALQDEARKLVGRHSGITLRVSGIEKLCERLKGSGVTFVEDLEVSPWGKMAVIADPDGNQFALVELPDALR